MEHNKRQLKTSPIVLHEPVKLKKEVNRKIVKNKKSLESKKLSDQFNATNPLLAKPGMVSYRQLRNLVKVNDLVGMVANRLKHAVLKIPWHVVPKERSKDVNELQNTQKKLQGEIDYAESLLRRPNSNGDTFRILFSAVIDDILAIDNGIIEKVRNAEGNVVELYQVDGATIKPNVDEHGIFKKVAYKQYMEDITGIGAIATKNPSAEFDIDDLLVFQINPSGESGKKGYGRSPVEIIVQTVFTSVQAMLYNSEFFNSDKLPPWMINLEGVKTEELIAFKEAFTSQLQGKPWAGAFTNAKDLKAQLLRPSNQEMQFEQFNLWLARIIFGAFGVSPQDVGFTIDVNRATAQVQRDITKTQGVANIMDIIAEEINMDLLPDLARNNKNFNELEFVWEQQDPIDMKVQAEVDEIYLKYGKVTVDELRVRDGQKPLGEDDFDSELEVDDEEEVDEEEEEVEIKKSKNSSKGKDAKKKWKKMYR